MNKIILFCLLFLTSCAAFIRTQSTKMISPEAHGGLGKGGAELRLEAQSRDRLNFDDDTVDNSIEQHDPYYALASLVEAGIFERLDVFFQPHIASPYVLGAKFQFLGKPRSEASKGNFSASVSLGFGNGGREYSDSSDLDIFNDNIEKIKIHQEHEEIGLIVGYRWADSWLQYANAFYEHSKVDGYVTKDSGPLQHTDFNYTMAGMIYSTGFMFNFGQRGYLKLDYSHFLSDWSKTGRHTVNTGNAALGFNW